MSTCPDLYYSITQLTRILGVGRFTCLFLTSPLFLYIEISVYRHKNVFPLDVNISGLHCVCLFLFISSETAVFLDFIKDLSLLIFFAGQHSIMATAWWKNGLSSFLNLTSQRILYNIVSSVVLLVLYIIYT